MKQITTYDACSIIEGFCDYDPTPGEVLEAFQYLVDTGIVWQLQGFYGRTASDLIQRGLLTPKK